MKFQILDSEKETKILSVSGMYCSGCAARIENVLKKVDGVQEIKVNFAVSTAFVEYDPNRIEFKEIQEKIKKLGYDSKIKEHPFAKDQIEKIKIERKKHFQEFVLFGISLLLSLPLLLHMIFDFYISHYLQFLLATPIQFIIGFRFHKGAWKTLTTGGANMDVLVSLGTNVAYFYSVFLLFFKNSHSVYFESSAMIITFVLLGKILENISKRRARQSIEDLFSLQPLICHKLVENHIEDIEIFLIRKGDIILIRPSENIPVDGIVIEGTSECDESLITGESLPILKKVGDQVYSGTTNLSGMLKVKVLEEPDHSTLSKIIKMVEETQNSKAPIQKLADSISGYFAFIVIGISFLAFFLSYFVFSVDLNSSILRSVSVLVIACPCALGLATPIAILIASGMSAKSGILFKNAEIIEATGNIQTLVFDKTGTLTTGDFLVYKYFIYDTSLNPIDSEKEQWVLKCIQISESASEHKIGQSLYNFIDQKNIKVDVQLKNLENFIGYGIQTLIESSSQLYDVFIGNEEWIKAQHPYGEHWINFIKRNFEDEHQISIPIYFVISNLYFGVFFLQDTLRKHSRQLIEYLKKNHIEIILATGDKQKTAERISKELGISKVYYEMKPEDKLFLIDELQKKNLIVGMVGDGMNDTPSLAKANISIAMGTGVSLSREVANINLIHDDILDIAYAIELSKKTISKIKQNLFFAFIYNIIGIPIAMLGYLSPAYAGFAMGMSSVSVVMSSLLLYRYTKQRFIKSI